MTPGTAVRCSARGCARRSHSGAGRPRAQPIECRRTVTKPLPCSPAADVASDALPVVIVGAGLAGLTVALHLAQHAAGGGARQARARRRRDRLGAGRHRRRARQRRQHRIARARHAGCRRRPGRRAHGPLHRRAQRARRSSGWSSAACRSRPTPTGPLGLHLTREGGHAVRRIAHAADATGKAIHDALLDEVRAPSEHHAARALDGGRPDHLAPPEARRSRRAATASTRSTSTASASRRCPRAAVVLATGGAGKVYRYTTNPDTSTGDGIAMAWRAGCRVGNMEFIQFHPTCLYHPQERSFLITEALRGEGGQLKLPGRARASCRAHDARGELAPRDIVARAIDFEMKKHGLDYVLLDATHLGEAFLKEHFPTIHARCLKLGIDITRAADPGGAGGALHLRRRGHRPGRPHRPARPVCGRRDHLHRPARRQPAGQQFAARMRGARPHLRRAHPAPTPSAASRRCRPGTRARSRTPTSRSSSPTTGTSCAC